MAARMGRHREAARRGLFALKKQMPPRRASPGKFVDWWGGDQPVYSLSAGWRHKSWIVGYPEVGHFTRRLICSETRPFLLHAACADEPGAVFGPPPASDPSRRESPAEARRACPSA